MTASPSHHLSARSQPLLAAMLAVAVAGMAGWYVFSGGLSDRLVHHDAPPPADVRFTVNVNLAPPAELAQLPGLGPATAARIVAYREQQGPFASHEDLLAVHGIGPVTLERLRPYLRPIDPLAEAP
ncbi:MAG: helix-hairpin-helix domain-containing protein [Planctomycetota bacterium]|nr:helix-hairpin-helix domain-containing protein [Planctomycetota bacterium]